MGIALERVVQRAGQAELSPVGWIAGDELLYAEWLRHGARLGVAGRGAGWWIGDWLRYGTTRYGRKYSAACRVTGYDRQTLMNMVYVATRFEISRRRENLSWSHHAQLAALEPQQQESWLDRCASERLTVRDLREELVAQHGDFRRSSAAALRGGPEGVSRSKTPNAKAVVCPHCGTEFTP